jgi:hypothetical protein
VKRISLLENTPMPIACRAALALLLVASAAPAQEMVQVATGQAAVLSGDKAAAREKAIEDALRQAVSMVAGTRVTSTTEVENFQTKMDEILTRASGHVKGYDIVKEGMDGDVVQVTIRARVSTASLDNDMEAAGLLMSRKGKPRTMLLIAEQNIGMTGPYAPWQRDSRQVGFDLRIAENVMLDELQKKGFKVVDPEIASEKAAKVGGISSEITAAQARELKKLTSAEVIVLGRVIALSRGNLGDLGPEWRSCTATMSARAVNTDNGDVLASSDATQQAAALDDVTCGKEAIKKASKAFVADITGKILARWNQDVSGGNSVRMTVKGQSLKQVSQFRKGLGAFIRGVKSVNQRSFSDGVAEIEVTLVGSTEQFAEELEAKKMGEFSVKVKNYSANTVDVELAAQ